MDHLCYWYLGYNLKATDLQAAIGVAQLKKIEGFRNLNADLENIINKGKAIKKKKKEGSKKTKHDSDEEKEYKSMRKELQEKLIRFATRIPVFMYLTDYREKCLKDIINA